MNLKSALHNGLVIAKNNMPTILTGVAIGGLCATAFFSGRGSIEAEKKLKELKATSVEPLTRMEKFKATYKYYIPAAFTGMITAISIIGANRLSLKQLAAMTTAAQIAERGITEHREAIESVFGEKGLRQIDEKVNEEHAARYFANTSQVHNTGKGQVLCCEGFLTGMLFYASREWVRKCVNEFNARLIAGEHLSYNEFITMLIPDVDTAVLPASGWIFGYNLDVKRRLLEIVEDSFLTYDSKEPGYIFKLADIPLLNYSEYF